MCSKVPDSPFEAIAVASAVAVLAWARWDWLLLSVVALSAPQFLVWLFHTDAALSVVAMSTVTAMPVLGTESEAVWASQISGSEVSLAS